MSNKISITEIKNLIKFEKQGGSWCEIYKGLYNDRPVIIKTQKPGSLFKTDKNDDRFLLEKERLELGIPGIIELLAWGDDFNGERFLILEQLYDIPEILQEDELQTLCDVVYLSTRKLYVNGFRWTPSLKHIKVDNLGNFKILDLNDDNDLYSVDECYSVSNYLKKLGASSKNLEKSIYKTIEAEYQSLDNVHQSIYFDDFAEIKKLETDPNDSKFMNLVEANRKGYDRLHQLKKGLSKFGHNNTLLDIGCNVGFFTFGLFEEGFRTVGIDYDELENPNRYTRKNGWPSQHGGKIDFCNYLSQLYYSGKGPRFYKQGVTLQNVNSLESYDIIIILSLLHLYITEHGYSVDDWKKFFIELSSKANKALVVEISGSIFKHLNVSSFEGMIKYLKDLASFKTFSYIGTSDNNRPLYILEK